VFDLKSWLNKSDFGIFVKTSYYGIQMLMDRYSPEHETVRRIIREIRRNHSLTQGELAKKLGVPQSWVSKIESGERNLAFAETGPLAEALGLTLQEFCTAYQQAIPKK